MIKGVCLIQYVKIRRKKSQKIENKIKITLGLSKASKWKDDNSSQSESCRFYMNHTS
jgi:hypothetical protein